MYTPLFAPVGIPMVVGLIKELLAWRRRQKARRDATTAAQAEAAAATEVDTAVDVDRGASGSDAALSGEKDAALGVEEKAAMPEQVPEQVIPKVEEAPRVGRVLRSRRSTPAVGQTT